MYQVSSHIREVNDIEFIAKLAKTWFIRRLGEDIGQLIISADSFNLDISLANMISKKMMPNINMLGSLVLYRIVGNLDSTFIIT
jgi:hypothetical protein